MNYIHINTNIRCSYEMVYMSSYICNDDTNSNLMPIMVTGENKFIYEMII